MAMCFSTLEIIKQATAATLVGDDEILQLPSNPRCNVFELNVCNINIRVLLG
jgi:hypothetical protein